MLRMGMMELFRTNLVLKQRRKIFTLMLLLFPKISGSLSGQENILPTHADFISDLSRKVAKDWISISDIDAGKPLVLHQDEDSSEISKIVGDRFVESLFNEGFTILSGKEIPIPSNHLQLSVVKADLRYDRIYRKRFLGRRWIQRSAEVRFFGRLSESQTGKLLWIGHVGSGAQDEFPLMRLPYVESDRMKGWNTVVPFRTEFRRWAEPSFVIIVFTSLIYLFFSVRSQ